MLGPNSIYGRPELINELADNHDCAVCSVHCGKLPTGMSV